MNQLKPLRRNHWYYNQIVAAKDDPPRATLQALSPAILSDYRKYIAHAAAGTLTLYGASVYTPPNSGYLLSCYSDIVPVNSLKTDIRNHQPSSIRFICQYCMIRDSGDSFDHYLPKGQYPEFAVLSNNLVPSCSRCNSIKSNVWFDPAGNRNILHFYYDVIPTVPFLTCTLSWRRGTELIRFQLQRPAGVPNSLYRIIERHFERLGLIKEYEERSNTEITNTNNILTGFAIGTPLADVRASLLRQVAADMVSYGCNYWKILIKEQLALSNQYLNNRGFF